MQLMLNATAWVKLPMGETDAIHINRGTIQGDSLSPPVPVPDNHGACSWEEGAIDMAA